ncbi:MAG: SDR family NAD(P)-dependent oxidoreductase [Christensenellales bacterium]|jgi:NAD(P)-dependent dehydrogenase (short-subunit alcohol dehydrogenase family)
MSRRKTALITGSSKGIGKATAIELARQGYDVGINYNSTREGAEDTAQKAQALGAKTCVIKADISDVSQTNDMFDKFRQEMGDIDLFVNNAGLDGVVPFLDTTPEIFDKLMGTNFRGAYFAVQRAAKEMIAQNNGGVIVIVSSIQAEGIWPDSSVYGSVKAALTKFSKHAAMELAPHKIRVAAIHPGYIDVGWNPADEFFVAQNRIPQQHFGKPQNIADMIAFIASDKAYYTTGAVFNVDGGVLLPCPSENSYFN